jgi:predicted DNA-binding transcriptional regulator YafY
LQILSGGRRVTTGELYRRFEGEVSRRTLQRDLLTLSEAGIPITSEKVRANENAWYLTGRYRTFIPLPLEVNEYLAAHILKANLKVFRKTTLEREVESLMRKLDQIVPEDVFLEVAQRGVEKLYENYAAGLFDYSPYSAVIDDLIRAIRERRQCEVTYFNPYRQSEKTFPIEPERIVYYNGGLYAIVYVRRYNQFILLAIQRIRKLVLRDEVFLPDHPFDAEDFWRGRFGLFQEEAVTVKLWFDKAIVHHIGGRSWSPTQVMEWDPEGNLILSMQVGLTPELVSWILGWRYFVTVLEPEELVTEIKENLRLTAANYETT